MRGRIAHHVQCCIAHYVPCLSVLVTEGAFGLALLVAFFIYHIRASALQPLLKNAKIEIKKERKTLFNNIKKNISVLL